MSRLLAAFWAALSVPGREVWTGASVDREAASRALVRVFYAILTYDSMAFARKAQSLQQLEDIRPLWPVAFVGRLVPLDVAGVVLPSLFFFGSVAALAFVERRGARVAAFLGVLLYFALDNSFGKIDHGGHAKILIALTFIWLPGRRGAQPPGAWSLGILGAQMVLGLLYSMSGLWKAAAIVVQLWRGHRTSLHLDGLAAQVSDRLLQTASETPLGPLIVEHGAWFAPLYWGGILVELIALPAVFRPGWQRLAGLLLIGLHAGLDASMGIGFSGHVLLLGVFFVASPFARSVGLGELCRTAPLLGPLLDAWWLARQARSRGPLPLVVDEPTPGGPRAALTGPDGVTRIGAQAAHAALLIAGRRRALASLALLVPPLFWDLLWAGLDRRPPVEDAQASSSS